MVLKQFGKFLRGKATPAQVMLATVLGCMLGFVPGFGQGAGLVVSLTILLVVLNANLFLAGIAGAVAKALSLALMPVSFALGRLLLEGPTEGVFRAAVNAPVLALFGFEHYATIGGVVLGLIIGVVMGAVIVAGLKRFRRLMMGLEERSPRFVALSRTWWARLLTFVLAGRGAAPGKETYEKLLQKKVGNPIRPLGAVAAVLAVVLLGILYQFASEPIVRTALRRGLERANGATVDISRAEVDLAAGRITIDGFAMADPGDLSRDLLRAATVEVDVSAADLLRKRIALDRLVLEGASSGSPRRIPGAHVGPPPRPAPPPPPPPGREDWQTLEDYLARARTWKERLAQVRRWLDRVAPQEAAEPADRAERVASAVGDLGYARVRADHLIEGAPTFAILELVARDVQALQLGSEKLTIRGRNLSTQPHLLPEPPYVLVESGGGTFRAEVGRASAPVASAETVPATGAAAVNVLAFHYRGLPAEKVVGQLAGSDPPLSGGTIDLEAAGTWSGGAPITIDLPLSITLHDTTLTLPGTKPTLVRKLVIPVTVAGPLDDPRLRVDEGALADALLAAGAGELADRVRGEAEAKLDEKLQEAKEDLGSKLGEKVGQELGETIGKEAGAVGDQVKKGLGDLLGGKKKEGG